MNDERLSLVDLLIEKGYVSSESEAEDLISDMRDRALMGEDPDYILLDYGIDADYSFDVITF